MFHVVKTSGNGYQCGCCKHIYTDSEWYDDRAEALAEVPREMPADNCDGHLEGIEVKDGATGDVIASVSMWFSNGYGRYSAYKAQRWYGFIDPGGDEDIIKIDECRGPGATWDECIAKIKGEFLEKQKKEAEKELEAAQKKLAWVASQDQSS